MKNSRNWSSNASTHATLRQGARTVAEADAKPTSEAPQFVFELRGRFLVLLVDGQTVLAQGVEEAR